MAIGRGVKNPSYRSRISYHSTLLGGFALLVTSILVVGNVHTREAIAQRLEEDTLALIAQVIPARMHDNNIVASVRYLENRAPDGKSVPLKVYQALRARQVTAVAYEVTGNGYAGPIKVILGIDRSGKILGVRVVSHAETPGLGDKIEEKKSDWIFGFANLSFDSLAIDQWKVKKDGGRFDQFTGATITPRAVVGAIKEGMETFRRLQQQMLSLDAPTTPVPENSAVPVPAGAQHLDLTSTHKG